MKGSKEGSLELGRNVGQGGKQGLETEGMAEGSTSVDVWETTPWSCGREWSEGGLKSEPDRHIALGKIQTFTRDKIRREEIRMQGFIWYIRRVIINVCTESMVKASCMVIAQRWTASIRQGRSATMRLILALNCFLESALVSWAKLNDKSHEESFVIENGTFIKHVHLIRTTKHAMVELGTIASELVDDLIQVQFKNKRIEVCSCVLGSVFMKGIGAIITLKRAMVSTLETDLPMIAM
jgi:hypothetical protein